MQGWRPKSSACPSKPRETKLFGRISRDFWRDVPGVPEKFEKKSFVFDFFDQILTRFHGIRSNQVQVRLKSGKKSGWNPLKSCVSEGTGRTLAGPIWLNPSDLDGTDNSW